MHRHVRYPQGVPPAVPGLEQAQLGTRMRAAVLFESVRPLPDPAAGWADVRPPYHGLPGQVVISPGKLADVGGTPLLPSVAARYSSPPARHPAAITATCPNHCVTT